MSVGGKRSNWASGNRRCQEGGWEGVILWQESEERELSNEAGETFEIEEESRGLRSE